MRIHRLTFQAIGPFPGRHAIDVDALSAGGLFLLEGPTGAGKSTIIDAIVFALYGKVAGAEASDDRLHSDHADPEVEPFVDLTFSTGSGVYRVWRSPRYLRPKRRGGGFTEQNPRAKLWRLSDPADETGEAVSAHVQEVGTEVARIVVLDRAQFTQTVVLPQGQFASFLRAKPEDRRTVLQDVFGTEIYERVQRQLAEMARTARADLDHAAGEITAATEAFVRAADLRDAEPQDAEPEPFVAGSDPVDAITGSADVVGPPDAAGPQDVAAPPDAAGPPAAGPQDAAGPEGSATGPDGAPAGPARVGASVLRGAARELDGDTLESGTEQVLADLTAEAEGTHALEAAASAAARAAQDQLDAERTLAGLLTRRAALLTEQAALAGRAEEIGAAEQRLDLARRAATVAGSLRAHADAANRLATATESWGRVRDDVANGPDADVLDATADGSDVELLADLHEQVTAEVGGLEELRLIEDELPRRQTALDATARSIDSDAEAVASLRVALDARPLLRQELVDHLAQARAGAAGLGAARAAADAAAAVVDAASTVEKHERERARAEAAVATATKSAVAAVDAEGEVRRRWIAGVAGALAAELRPGRPCSVCGSTDHPAPAERGEDGATTQDVEDAEHAREQAQRRLTETAELLTRLDEKLAGLRERTGGRDLPAARAEHEDARRLLAAAEQAAARVTGLEGELAAFDEQTAVDTATVADSTAGLAEREGNLKAVRTRLEADRARCARAAGDMPSVAARADALTHRARRVRALLDARREQVAADGACTDTAGRLAAELAHARLADAEEARRGTLSTAETAQLARRIDEHRVAGERVRSALAEPDVAALTGEEVTDVDAAAAARTAASEALTAATRRASEASVRASQSGSARTELLTALAGHASLAERAAPVLRTAALANAGEGNETATTLATYVLVRRFEDVVAAANDRLVTMSDGRYALERIDEKEGGQRSRRAGLGLQVRDQLTETPRDPRTLSGGETFYVSLCLALGLADVVRGEAGGIELGTLFVDEGFGSLDPETLDAVMGELGRLREGGRAVGIVSHVAELKDRIAERIEVRRLPSGASTLTVQA